MLRLYLIGMGGIEVVIAVAVTIEKIPLRSEPKRFSARLFVEIVLQPHSIPELWAEHLRIFTTIKTAKNHLNIFIVGNFLHGASEFVLQSNQGRFQICFT